MRVVGEISNLSRAGSGHIYLNLKDKSSQINGIIWNSTVERMRFEPAVGMDVLCVGDIDVYPPRGVYQLIIRQIQPLGIGELELRFRQLYGRLKAEGLFDPSRKRPLPAFPNRIAVVTSPSGAAIRDFLQVAIRRWPSVEIVIVPVRVQGEGSAQEIATAVCACGEFEPLPDLVVVTRGGGSIEDLWSFNEEIVCRAVAECPIPVISGVGHEIDTTLCDLAADVRALTPSEAAERVVPDQKQWRQRLRNAASIMKRLLRNRLQSAEQQVEALTTRPVMLSPLEPLERLSVEVDELERRLGRGMGDQLTRSTHEISRLSTQIESVNPLKVLARGYSVTMTDDARVVSRIEDVAKGGKIESRVTDGTIYSVIEEIRPAE